MIQDRLNHTPQEILDKEFKIDTRGYRLKEVDQYLDEVIVDYETLLETIKKQEAEKEELLTEIMHLKQELRNVRMSVDIAKEENTEVTNVDILRRLSSLEKMVYGTRRSESREQRMDMNDAA